MHVIEWHKREGDPVRRGDVLFEIETDKSVMDVEAFDDGVLLDVVAEGGTGPGQLGVRRIGEAGEAIPDAPPVAAPTALAATAQAASRRRFRALSQPTWRSAWHRPPRAPPRPAADSSAVHRLPPAASRSVLAQADSRRRAASILEADGHRPRRSHCRAGRPDRDHRTGPDRRGGARATGRPSPDPPRPMPRDGDGEPRPMSRMRRVIAERLTTSWTTTPHFTITVAVDMTGSRVASRAQDRRHQLTVTGLRPRRDRRHARGLSGRQLAHRRRVAGPVSGSTSGSRFRCRPASGCR